MPSSPAVKVVKPTREQFLIALAEIEKFSAAPRILARAMTLLRNPDSDLGSVAMIVGSDPALAADVIRCSNSAYYGTGARVQTIGEAVQKIGFRETIHLLNSAVARIATSHDLHSYRISADNFWSESLFHGLFLFGLAGEVGKSDPDEAYTVGLLRFIGRLAIDQSIRDPLFYYNGGESIGQWEEKTVGLSQCHAGAMLLAKWRFSDEMIQAVVGQEAPASLAQPSWLAEGLRFAGQLLPQGRGVPIDSKNTMVVSSVSATDPFLVANGLTIAGVESLLTSTRDSFESVRNSFFGKN